MIIAKRKGRSEAGKGDTLHGVAWHGVGVGVGIGVGVASSSASASASASVSASALALALRGEGVAWRGVAAWRGEAWRVTLIRTDTALDHSQRPGRSETRTSRAKATGGGSLPSGQRIENKTKSFVFLCVGGCSA